MQTERDTERGRQTNRYSVNIYVIHIIPTYKISYEILMFIYSHISHIHIQACKHTYAHV